MILLIARTSGPAVYVKVVLCVWVGPDSHLICKLILMYKWSRKTRTPTSSNNCQIPSLVWLRHRVWFTINTTGPTLWGPYLEYLLEAGPLSGLSHFALVYDLRLVVPLSGPSLDPFGVPWRVKAPTYFARGA